MIPPVFVGDHRVLSEPDIEAGRIVGQNMLQERQGLFTADDETSHVRNVEQPGTLTRCQVFLQNAVRVLQRHIPAAEFRNFCTCFKMAGVENGSQCVAHQIGSWSVVAGPRLLRLRSFTIIFAK